MAPSPRRNNPLRDKGALRKAGVLFLLYSKEGQIHLPFIKRTSYAGPHSGQIALPGGRQEKEDKDLVATAVRETYEEIGVQSSYIQVLGTLTPVYIPNSHYMVTPSVSYVLTTPHFKPDPTEVRSVLEIRLAHLRDPACRKREIWNIRNLDVDVPFFLVGQHRIWGATAMMLAELLAVIGQVEKQEPRKYLDFAQ